MLDVAALQAVPIFGGLMDEEVELIRALLEPRTVGAGDELVVEGTPGNELFVIEEGQASVMKRLPDGQLTCFAELGPGSCFGEMALIGVMPRSASVCAKTPLHALALPYAKIARLSEQHPHVFLVLVMNLAREVCRRLLRANAVLCEFGLIASPTHR
jgi:CRP/FNR family transcriptional regulator, cyclic AMP receptor protein